MCARQQDGTMAVPAGGGGGGGGWHMSLGLGPGVCVIGSCMRQAR